MHGSRFSLPAVLALLLVTSTLAGQLLVPGAERRLSDPQLGAAFGYQFGGSVAANTAEFVASWMTNGRVFVSRIDFRGHVLDPGGVPLPFTDVPTLAGMGSGFLAIGRDGTRLRAVSFTNELLIYASNDVGDFDFNSYLRDVATSGTKAFVLVQVGDEFRGRVINEISRPETDWISFGSHDARRVALIANPDGFVLFVAKGVVDPPDGNALYAQRISVTGQLSAWQQVAVSQFLDVQWLRAAFDGQKDIVVWSTQRDIKAVVLSAETFEPSDTFAITPTATTYGSTPLLGRVVGRGLRSLIFFSEGSTPQTVVVANVDDRTKTVTSKVVVAEDANSLSINIASGAMLLFVWPHAGVADLDLYARQLDPGSGVPSGDPFLVSHSAREQQSPRVATNGSIDLVVWSEVDTDTSMTRIMAVRLSREGGVLDQPFPLSEAGRSCATPDVAFDGEHFVAVWNDGVTGIFRSGRVVARRVGLDGGLVDGVPIVIGDEVAATPTIACGDDRCLVAWTTGRQIGTAILTRGGAVTSPMFMGVEDNPTDALDPHVAFGGGTFAVGWRALRFFGDHSPVYTASRLAFLTRDGLPTVGLHLRDMLMDWSAEAPHVGWNGSDFVSAWQVNSILHAARFSPAGVSLGPTAIVDMTGATGKLNHIAYVGGAWLLSVEQEENALTSARIGGIYLRDTAALPRVLAFTIDGDGRDPVLASVGNHAVFVYRRRVTDTPFGGANRVFLRELDVIAIPETSLPRRRSAKS